MATARDVIARLKSQGHSYSSIGKALGRDSSYISQIARGKRSGESYVSALSGLEKGTVSQPTRRTTKTGTPAKVRQPILRDDKGRVSSYTTKTPNGKQVQTTLNKAAKDRVNMSVIVHLKRFKGYNDSSVHAGSIQLWSKGASAKWVTDEMARTGMSFTEVLESQLQALPHVDVASGVQRVDINFDYPIGRPIERIKTLGHI